MQYQLMIGKLENLPSVIVTVDEGFVLEIVPLNVPSAYPLLTLVIMIVLRV